MKFSIITCVLNNSKNIKKSLTSFQNQDFKNKEHIIIDGGSTDGTINIIKKNKKKNIKLVSSSDNGIYSDILKRDIFENAQIHKIKFPTSVLVTNTYLKHPATVVYVDRGKDTCTAVFGESFSMTQSHSRAITTAENR